MIGDEYQMIDYLWVINFAKGAGPSRASIRVFLGWHELSIFSRSLYMPLWSWFVLFAALQRAWRQMTHQHGTYSPKQFIVHKGNADELRFIQYEFASDSQDLGFLDTYFFYYPLIIFACINKEENSFSTLLIQIPFVISYMLEIAVFWVKKLEFLYLY